MRRLLRAGRRAPAVPLAPLTGLSWLQRRGRLEVVRLTVFESDAGTGRRSSVSRAMESLIESLIERHEGEEVAEESLSLIPVMDSTVDGASVFEQLERQLPFEEWEQLRMFVPRRGLDRAEHSAQSGVCDGYAPLYVRTLDASGALAAGARERCRQVLDVERRDEIFSRGRRGHELALFQVSRRAAHEQFVLAQSLAWLAE
jgi:hypothetical protein